MMQNYMLASLLSNIGLDSRMFHLLNLARDVGLGLSLLLLMVFTCLHVSLVLQM